MIGRLTICRILKGSKSLKHTQLLQYRSGTDTKIEPTTTSALPTKMDKAPNSAGDPDGYHRTDVKNSLNPSIWKKGMASLKMK